MTAGSPRGVIAPILTPFNDDLTIAEDLLVAHAERLLAEGCVALAPFGTTGEALSVGSEERLTALKALIAGGIDPQRLIPGTGLTALSETAALSRACLDLGCPAVMTLPPFYYKGVSEEGLYAYFARLIEWIGPAGLAIYLYHIPPVAVVGLPPSLVRRLFVDFPEAIVGIKDSSGDWSNTEALLAIEGLTVYPGSEVFLLQGLKAGSQGCITATANLNAAALADVVAAHDAGESDDAAARQEAASALRRLIESYGNIPAQKHLLAERHGDPRWRILRPPLMALTQARGRDLVDRLAAEHGFTL